MHYHNTWIHANTCTVIIGNSRSVSTPQFGWRREEGRLVKFVIEDSSQSVRIEEVDKLVNKRVNEYIQNNLGLL